MFLDAFFYALVDIEEVVDGLYPALLARITIPHSPSAQPTFRLGRLHQFLLHIDVTPGARPFMARVMNNMAPMGCETFKGLLVFR